MKQRTAIRQYGPQYWTVSNKRPLGVKHYQGGNVMAEMMQRAGAEMQLANSCVHSWQHAGKGQRPNCGPRHAMPTAWAWSLLDREHTKELGIAVSKPGMHSKASYSVQGADSIHSAM